MKTSSKILAHALSSGLIYLSLIIFFFGISSTSSRAETEIGVATDTGWINFIIEDNWQILSSYTKMPIASFTYRLPDPISSKVKSKTKTVVFPKLVIKLFQRREPQRGKKKAPQSPINDYFAKQLGDTPPIISNIPHWQIATQSIVNNSMKYTVLDAKRNIADIDVFVRLSWPHLADAPANYNKKMNEVFSDFLSTIIGGMGVYTPTDAEKIRNEDKLNDK